MGDVSQGSVVFSRALVLMLIYQHIKQTNETFSHELFF
jgi:hypothetical protein